MRRGHHIAKRLKLRHHLSLFVVTGNRCNLALAGTEFRNRAFGGFFDFLIGIEGKHMIVGKVDQCRGDLLFSPPGGHGPFRHFLKGDLHRTLTMKAPIGIIDRNFRCRHKGRGVMNGGEIIGTTLSEVC
ncbi:MAG: hypothetical protein AAAC48_10625, partial [Phyllobacterium sp.]|uniref:hypothetical protein n=1 Tax=Phyllobacterium sp. TaxID=1871046 RepID=UPI0030F1A451